MLHLKDSVSKQVHAIKAAITNLFVSSGADTTQHARVFDLLVSWKLIDRIQPWSNNTRQATLIGYREHDILHNDFDAAFGYLIDTKQISWCEDVDAGSTIDHVVAPGDHKDLCAMISRYINKQFALGANFMMPLTITQVLFPDTFLVSLPTPLVSTALEANKALEVGLRIACGILLRRLIEGSILLKLKQEGKEKRSLNANGTLRGLSDLINIAANEYKLDKHLVDYLKDVKLVGDKAAHSFDVAVFQEDIERVMPIVRDFLTLLRLK